MLRKVLAIAGKPGLYELISRGNGSLIVSTIDAAHRRMPIFGTDKVISLADIAMYTDEEEVPLISVFNSLKELEGGKPSAFEYKKASKEELAEYMGKILPNFDRDRVYPSDIKKLVQWYNILVENGFDDFTLPTPPAAAEAETEAAAEEPTEA